MLYRKRSERLVVPWTPTLLAPPAQLPFLSHLARVNVKFRLTSRLASNLTRIHSQSLQIISRDGPVVTSMCSLETENWSLFFIGLLPCPIEIRGICFIFIISIQIMHRLVVFTEAHCTGNINICTFFGKNKWAIYLVDFNILVVFPSWGGCPPTHVCLPLPVCSSEHTLTDYWTLISWISRWSDIIISIPRS